MVDTRSRRPAEAAGPVPPHDLGAEEAVIAAVLIDTDSYWNIEPILRAPDFFDGWHEWCWRAIEHIVARGEPVTLPTLAHELDRTYSGTETQLEIVGGEPWLVELVGRHFSSVGVEAHARIVARDSRYRRMLQASNQIAQMASEGGPDDERVMSAATRLIEGVRSDSPMLGAVSTESIATGLLANDLGISDRGIRGITAGYKAIDIKTHGYAPGEIIGVGGDTSVGKTAFAVGAARRQAEAGVRVGYVPVEGDRTVLTQRIAASYAGFTLQALQQMDEGWTPGMRRKYEDAMHLASMLPIYWPDRYIERVGDICSWISVQAHQVGIQVAYVDHIDVVRADRDRDGRASEIADIMRQLQNTARRENVAIVFLSQINRAAAAKHKMPTIRDLREAGAKEELSQVVILLHRNDQFGFFSRPYLQAEIGKNTEGTTGKITRVDDLLDNDFALVFNPRTAGVEELGVDELRVQ